MTSLETSASSSAATMAETPKKLIASGDGAGALQGHSFSLPLSLGWMQRVLLSLLLMAMFCEWLYPVRQLMEAGTGRWFSLFVVLTALLLITGCLPLYRSAYGGLIAGLIAGSFYYLYGYREGVDWLREYGVLLARDWGELIQSGSLHGVSGESRTLLLMIGWGLLVSSVQKLALGRHGILLFFSASVLYLLVLELALDASFLSGMIRMVLWGLLLQVFITGYARQPAGMIRGKGLGIGAALICVIAAVVTIQLLPAKSAQDISWGSLVQTVERWSKAYSGTDRAASPISVSGYGRDDSRLGAPLTLRREVYFTAVSPVNSYWRGESKSVYTGHGWASLLLAPEPVPALPGATEVVQQIRFKQPISDAQPIFSAGTPVGLTSIYTSKQHTKTAAEGMELRYDPGTTAMYVEQAASEQPLYGYELLVSVRGVPEEELIRARGTDPEEIIERELQLPATLPDRVRELGVELTAGRDNRYESVQSVLEYLKDNYTYSLDSQLPIEEWDFTEYFLFQQRQGYCDHFSTAMTVLLRSGGIPARWVKGFAPGTAVSSDPQQYNISYADAHSWVEVYFPEVGWVPFDPTPGFGLEQPAIGAMADIDNAYSVNFQWRELVEHVLQWSREGQAMAQGLFAHIKGNLLLWSSMVLIGGLLLLLVLLYGRNGYRRALYLLWPFLYRRARAGSFPDRMTLLNAADQAWKGLYVAYGSKTGGSTAREYVLSVSQAHEELVPDLERFISLWERLYYGNDRLDRSASRDFLEVCRQLALGKS